MGWFRRHPVWTILAVVALLAFGLIASSAITVWRAAHHDGAADIEHADAIVVLGAAQYDGVPSPLFQGRLDHAVLLWDQSKADLVITVGSKQIGDRHTEAEAGRTYLISQGVPEDSVVAIAIGHSTYQSLQAAANEMQRRGIRSALLVSDPWHNARLNTMASALGIDGYASATWTSAAASESSRAEGYVRETFAYLYYRIFGG
ncbi:MAG: YdcF family protein [Actinomycetota bacterium]|nr:YdcF family protein [Actinomycetota bacterium]